MTDLLNPIPVEEQPTHYKTRWFSVNIINGETTSEKWLEAAAQEVPVRIDPDTEEVIRTPGIPRMAPQRNVRIPFNPEDPRHVQLLELMETLIREADDLRATTQVTTTT